jgi:SsrA-binding protein
MSKDISVNRKALRDFHIVEKMEAGLELKGTEVKAIRLGLVNVNNGFARVENDQAWLYDVDIQPYEKASYEQHVPKRRRRLLLHRREIERLIGLTQIKGQTLVAIRLYWKGHRVKVELGLGRGKEKADLRADLKEKTEKREADREMTRFNRRHA